MRRVIPALVSPKQYNHDRGPRQRRDLARGQFGRSFTSLSPADAAMEGDTHDSKGDNEATGVKRVRRAAVLLAQGSVPMMG